MYILLLLLPILLLFIGIVVLVIYLCKMIFCTTVHINDCSYECLNSDPEKIRQISIKYGKRTRGSIRLSQGRIKSVEEIKQKEKNISFP